MAGPADAYLGQTLAGRYELVSHLADGYFSHVFNATDQHSGAQVAVKMLQPSAAVKAEPVTEFHDEGRFLDTLKKSSNVVSMLDWLVIAELLPTRDSRCSIAPSSANRRVGPDG